MVTVGATSSRHIRHCLVGYVHVGVGFVDWSGEAGASASAVADAVFMLGLFNNDKVSLYQLGSPRYVVGAPISSSAECYIDTFSGEPLFSGKARLMTEIRLRTHMPINRTLRLGRHQDVEKRVESAA